MEPPAVASGSTASGVRDCAPRAAACGAPTRYRSWFRALRARHRHGFGGIWYDQCHEARQAESASTPAHARDGPRRAAGAVPRAAGSETVRVAPRASAAPGAVPSVSTNAAAASFPPLPPRRPVARRLPTRRARLGAPSWRGRASRARLTVAAPSASSRSPLLRRRRRRPQPGDARLASPRRRVAGDLAGSSAWSSVRDHDEDALTSAPRRGNAAALSTAPSSAVPGSSTAWTSRRSANIRAADVSRVIGRSAAARAANATGRRGAPRAGRAGRPSPPCALQARRAPSRQHAATRRRRRRRPRPGPLTLSILHPRRSRERRHSSASAPTIAVAPSACRRDARRTGSARSRKRRRRHPWPAGRAVSRRRRRRPPQARAARATPVS